MPLVTIPDNCLPCVMCVHTGVPTDQVLFYNQTTNGDPRTGVTAMSVSAARGAWADGDSSWFSSWYTLLKTGMGCKRNAS